MGKNKKTIATQLIEEEQKADALAKDKKVRKQGKAKANRIRTEKKGK